MPNFHWELVRQHDQKDWPELAPSAMVALNYLYRDKKIDVQLELCAEPDQYVLKRCHQVDGQEISVDAEEIFHVRKRRS